MAKKKVNEASGKLNPDETKILTYVFAHPDILTQVKNASDPMQELGSLVDFDSLGIDPNAQYELGDVLQFLDLGEAALDERVVTDKVVAAFLAGQPKKVSNTHTDGKSFFLFNNEIAKKENDGLYISDAGWDTPTTRERINGILKGAGIDAGVFKKKGAQMLSLHGKDMPWDGKWIKVSDEMKGEDWEGSGPQTAQSMMGNTTRIPMMQDKVQEKKQVKLPKWAKKIEGKELTTEAASVSGDAEDLPDALGLTGAVVTELLDDIKSKSEYLDLHRKEIEAFSPAHPSIKKLQELQHLLKKTAVQTMAVTNSLMKK